VAVVAALQLAQEVQAVVVLAVEAQLHQLLAQPILVAEVVVVETLRQTAHKAAAAS
jgi:hypothetical protein